MTGDTVKVDAIRVEDRARRQYEGIDSLAASIQSLGLLHPVVVTRDLQLIAGGRRLHAVRSLGWESVPVTYADSLTDVVGYLQAESDENAERMPLKPTEAADLARKIEAVLKPVARERMEAGGKLPQGPQPKTRDVAAKAAGTSATSIRKVRVVQELVESDTTPEPVREIAREALAEMDETGRVDSPFRRVKQAEEIVAAQPSEAVVAHLEADQTLQDANYVLAFLKSLSRADDFLRFDAERLAQLDPEATRSVEHLLKSVTSFYARMESGSGLRLIAGGK